jgi:hypothetical protein
MAAWKCTRRVGSAFLPRSCSPLDVSTISAGSAQSWRAIVRVTGGTARSDIEMSSAVRRYSLTRGMKAEFVSVCDRILTFVPQLFHATSISELVRSRPGPHPISRAIRFTIDEGGSRESSDRVRQCVRRGFQKFPLLLAATHERHIELHVLAGPASAPNPASTILREFEYHLQRSPGSMQPRGALARESQGE